MLSVNRSKKTPTCFGTNYNSSRLTIKYHILVCFIIALRLKKIGNVAMKEMWYVENVMKYVFFFMRSVIVISDVFQGCFPLLKVTESNFWHIGDYDNYFCFQSDLKYPLNLPNFYINICTYNRPIVFSRRLKIKYFNRMIHLFFQMRIKTLDNSNNALLNKRRKRLDEGN